MPFFIKVAVWQQYKLRLRMCLCVCAKLLCSSSQCHSLFSSQKCQRHRHTLSHLIENTTSLAKQMSSYVRLRHTTGNIWCCELFNFSCPFSFRQLVFSFFFFFLQINHYVCTISLSYSLLFSSCISTQRSRHIIHSIQRVIANQIQVLDAISRCNQQYHDSNHCQ